MCLDTNKETNHIHILPLFNKMCWFYLSCCHKKPLLTSLINHSLTNPLPADIVWLVSRIFGFQKETPIYWSDNIGFNVKEHSEQKHTFKTFCICMRRGEGCKIKIMPDLPNLSHRLCSLCCHHIRKFGKHQRTFQNVSQPFPRHNSLNFVWFNEYLLTLLQGSVRLWNVWPTLYNMIVGNVYRVL